MNSLKKNAYFFLYESLLEDKIFLCFFGNSVRLWLGFLGFLILGISVTKVESVIEFTTVRCVLSERS